MLQGLEYLETREADGKVALHIMTQRGIRPEPERLETPMFLKGPCKAAENFVLD